MSTGSRQTRRQRRARSRRARRKNGANFVLLEIVAAVHRSAKSIEWPVLFFAMLAALVGAVVSVLAGEVVLAGCLFVSSLLLCVALWARELN